MNSTEEAKSVDDRHPKIGQCILEKQELDGVERPI